MTTNRRVGSVLLLLIGATFGFHSLPHGKEVALSAPLSSLPRDIGPWHGQDVQIDSSVLHALAVDDYLNRTYKREGAEQVQLYVGYYASQRTDESIHSPQNCLPGSGWQPISADYIEVRVPDGRSLVINRYLVQKGLDRQVVLYWYQSHGRVVASEYRAKVYLVLDAIHLHRTDSALVRINTALTANGQDRVRKFVTDIWAELNQRLPK